MNQSHSHSEPGPDERTGATYAAINQLVASFVHHADRGNAQELASLFTEDGILEWVGIASSLGRDAIRQWIDTARDVFLTSPTPAIRHHCSSMYVEVVNEHSANVWSYWLAVSAERGPDHWGRYRDAVRRENGVWLFHHRKVLVDGQQEDSVSVRAAEVAKDRSRSTNSE